MRKLLLILAALTLVTASTASAGGGGHGNRTAARYAYSSTWHGNYYHTNYGYPLALVVPPTANMQTKMGWGVSQNEMVPIYHQFRRPYYGDVSGGGVGGLFAPTPPWPSHTDQFGVYYIRGPW